MPARPRHKYTASRKYNSGHANNDYNTCTVQHDNRSDTEHDTEHNGGHANNKCTTGALSVIVYCNVRNIYVYCKQLAGVPWLVFCDVCNQRWVCVGDSHAGAGTKHNDAYAEQQHYNDACALHYDIWSGTEHHIDHNGECFDNQYSTRAMCVIMCCNVRNVCVFCSRHADVP